MGHINNLNQGDFPDMLRRLRALETATPFNNAAIGRGGLRVYGDGGIAIENGGLILNGLPITTQKPNLYVDSKGVLYRSTYGG